MIKRNKPLKRVPLKRKPCKIKKVSDKKKVEDERYFKEREGFLKEEANKICNAQLECKGDEATDVHHKKGRGKYYLDRSTWLAVCRKCHRRITDNSKEAIELGLSVSRLKKDE